ncbi:MAG: hypothetical protein QNJ33_18590 [Crocosphaera sp.]|nr:hypothetical protein [Crocosphaera sp.]
MFRRKKESKSNLKNNFINPDAKSWSVLLLVVGLFTIAVIDPSYRNIFVSVATSAISVQLALNIQNVGRK